MINKIELLLPVLTIAGQLILVGGVILFILRKENFLLKLVQRKAFLFSFIVVLIATAGSLFYSEVAGFAPCKLCWFQRIFMYSQVVVLAVALLKNDRTIAVYNLALSSIGALVADYHYLIQIGAAPAVSCSVVGYSVSCSETFAPVFGYITIPLMALTAFLMVIFFSLVSNEKFF